MLKSAVEQTMGKSTHVNMQRNTQRQQLLNIARRWWSNQLLNLWGNVTNKIGVCLFIVRARRYVYLIHYFTSCMENLMRQCTFFFVGLWNARHPQNNVSCAEKNCSAKYITINVHSIKNRQGIFQAKPCSQLLFQAIIVPKVNHYICVVNVYWNYLIHFFFLCPLPAEARRGGLLICYSIRLR